MAQCAGEKAEGTEEEGLALLTESVRESDELGIE